MNTSENYRHEWDAISPGPEGIMEALVLRAFDDMHLISRLGASHSLIKKFGVKKHELAEFVFGRGLSDILAAADFQMDLQKLRQKAASLLGETPGKPTDESFDQMEFWEDFESVMDFDDEITAETKQKSPKPIGTTHQEQLELLGIAPRCIKRSSRKEVAHV